MGQTDRDFKYLGQYAKITDDDEYVWKRYANEIEETLNLIYKLYDNDLKVVTKKDYWYAYQVMWKNKINWFMRVNIINSDDIKKAKIIEKVEKMV